MRDRRDAVMRKRAWAGVEVCAVVAVCIDPTFNQRLTSASLISTSLHDGKQQFFKELSSNKGSSQNFSDFPFVARTEPAVLSPLCFIVEARYRAFIH